MPNSAASCAMVAPATSFGQALSFSVAQPALTLNDHAGIDVGRLLPRLGPDETGV
jgi:hypothetical protein